MMKDKIKNLSNKNESSSIYTEVRDEVDLLDLSRLLLSYWKLIISLTLLFGSLSAFFAFSISVSYKAETLLVPASEEQSSTSRGQFDGLAAMAGISIPGSSSTARIVATLNSRRFLGSFIENHKLMPVLFAGSWDSKAEEWVKVEGKDNPTPKEGVELLQSQLSISVNKESGLISLSFLWSDPLLASKWVNLLVIQLNDQMRQEAIVDAQKRIGYLDEELTKTKLKDMRDVLYSLLESEKRKAMLANVNEDFALEVIDPAVPPKDFHKPNRKLITIAGILFGTFLGIFFVFFIQFIKKLRN